MFRVSTTPIIRGTQNCNYSLRYCAATSLERGQAWPRWRKVATQYRRLYLQFWRKVCLLFCKFTLHVSGVNHTHHQEYTKLYLQPPVHVATLEGGSYTKVLPVPEALVTVLCTPDDGYGWHPKHIEWTCRKIDCFVLHLVGQSLTLWTPN